MNNQLTELLTNYGPVGAIWFDGWWDQDGNPGFNWELPEQYAMIHKLQPGCLIGNNHHQTPFAGEDIRYSNVTCPEKIPRTFRTKCKSPAFGNLRNDEWYVGI